MRQIKYEILKHMNKFNIIFVAAMLVANFAVVFFQYIDYLNPQATVIKQIKSELFYDYKKERDKFNDEYRDFQERKNEYEMLQRQSALSKDTAFILKFPNKKIDLESYGDRQLYRDVLAIINRAEHYNENINNILFEAHSRMKEMGIEARGQYVYEYQLSLILHYSKLANLEIAIENQYGWNDFFTLTTPVIFLVITFLGVFANIFIIEKRTRILNILNICKYGGSNLIISKLLTLIIFSVSLTLLFSLSPLVILNFTTGLSDPKQYIQAVDMFEFVPYLLEIWQYLFIFIIVRVALFLILALFISVVGQLLSSEIFVFSLSFVFLIINYIISLADINSPLFFLKKFSFFELAFVNVLFDRYRAVNVFDFHIGFSFFTGLLLCLFFASLIILSIVFKFKNKSMLLINFKSKSINANKKIESFKLTNGFGTSILKFEFNKYLLNKRHIIILIIAAAAKIIISNIYFTPITTNEEKIYQNYIENLKGDITQSQYEFIKEEREYINRAMMEFEEARLDFRDGKMDINEFAVYNQRYNYAKSVERPFDRVDERYRYLTSILNKNENFDNIEYIYDVGAVKYLFSFFDIILVLFAIVIFSDIFSNEYQSGFIMLMSISKYGGNKTFRAKYFFGLITITASYLFFTFIDLFFLFKNFEMSYLNIGIMSIPDFESFGINMSILQYFIIFKIISYIGFTILTLLIISISNIMKHILKAALIIMFLLFVPAFLEYFGVNILNFMNITSILSPALINENIPQYIFCFISAGVLFIKSRLNWVKK